MQATAEMKQGGKCDLLKYLAQHPEFNMTEGEMKEVLKPELYIGRCPQQVEEYINKVNPLLEGLYKEEPEINV